MKAASIQLIGAERWQNELIEAIVDAGPRYVYRVADELGRLFDEEKYNVAEYDPFAGSGLPDFIVCNQKPTDKELREALQDVADDLEIEAEEEEVA